MKGLLAISIIIHATIFLGTFYIFYQTAKREKYLKKDWLVFLLVPIFLTPIEIISLIYLIRQMPGGNVMGMSLMGYTGFPVFPFVAVLLTYPIIHFLNHYQKWNVKYSLIFWGIILSAPIAYGVASLLTYSRWLN